MPAIAAQPDYSPQISAFVARDPRLLIDGAWRSSSHATTLPVVDPSSKREIGALVDSSSTDVDGAVAAARRAFDDGRWTGLPPSTRERLLHRLADLLEDHAEEFATLEAIDTGKPRAMAGAVDIPGAIRHFRYMAGWPSKLTGDHVDPSAQPGGKYHGYVRREALGVAALIVPWNFPLLMAAAKLAPALAAGCTMILKPAEQTSLTALRFGDLVLEAGLPAGVVNIVTGRGDGAGDLLVRHPDVDKVAFTGSTNVGKIITRAAADTLKRVTLELGGKSPMLVMADMDVESAVVGAANGIFYNSGQVCIASSRLYAHRSIFDHVVEGVAGLAERRRLGPSLVEGSEMGPLVSSRQQERVMTYIEGARQQGASIATGGNAAGDLGFYVEPTVLVDVKPDMTVMREEVFGPVLCATRFDDLDDVVRHANDTDYGLGASIWTRDLATMHGVAARIKAGLVWGNCHSVTDPSIPAGGFKQSGIGREHGLEGLLNYTQTKSVLIAL